VEPGQILRQAAAGISSYSGPAGYGVAASNPLGPQPLQLNSLGGSSAPWTLPTGGEHQAMGVPRMPVGMDYSNLMGEIFPPSLSNLTASGSFNGGQIPSGKSEPICCLDSLHTHLAFLSRINSDKVLKLRGTTRLQRETMFDTLAQHFGQFGTVKTILLTDCMLVKSGKGGVPFKTRLGNMGFIVMDDNVAVARAIMHSPHHVGNGSCVLKVENFSMKDMKDSAPAGPQRQAPPQPAGDPVVAPLVKMHLDLQDKVRELEKKLTTLTKPEAAAPSTQSQLMAEFLLREVRQQLAGGGQQVAQLADASMLPRAPLGYPNYPAQGWPQVPVVPDVAPVPDMAEMVNNLAHLCALQFNAAHAQTAPNVPTPMPSVGKGAQVAATATGLPGTATSLRDILVELQSYQPACVFVVRGISTISSRAADAVDLLASHFSVYGPVNKVLVPHQKIKAHLDQTAQLQVKARPDNRGFILMKDPRSVQKIMDAGPVHVVCDTLGQIHRVTTEQFQPSLEGPSSPSYENAKAGADLQDNWIRGCSNDSTEAPSGASNSGIPRNASYDSNCQSLESKFEADSAQAMNFKESAATTSP